MFAKTIAAFVVFAVATVPVAMGQVSAGLTGEPLSVEMMLIRENSMALNREQNMFALEYTNNAIGGGGVDAEIYAALERLVHGSTLNRIIAGGRVANDFPDVRREAARQLGAIGSQDARAILMRACLAEREPMVLQEVMASLGGINSDNNHQTSVIIVRVAGRAHRYPAPNNHVALAAVNALESLASMDGGITYPGAFWYIFDVAGGPYVPVVRQRAQEVIDSLR